MKALEDIIPKPFGFSSYVQSAMSNWWKASCESVESHVRNYIVLVDKESTKARGYAKDLFGIETTGARVALKKTRRGAGDDN